MSIEVETARDILLDAFEDIVVRMDETTLGASDEATGIKAINRIMATLAANGVAFGFTKLTKINDPVTIPDGAMDALVSILALRMWPKYRSGSGDPSLEIVKNARAGVKQMYKLGISISVSEFPSTLSRGSGNDEPGSLTDTFYDNLAATILAENSGSISLEDDTND